LVLGKETAKVPESCRELRIRNDTSEDARISAYQEHPMQMKKEFVFSTISAANFSALFAVKSFELILYEYASI
jgi:hypothetical protein